MYQGAFPAPISSRGARAGEAPPVIIHKRDGPDSRPSAGSTTPRPPLGLLRYFCAAPPSFSSQPRCCCLPREGAASHLLPGEGERGERPPQTFVSGKRLLPAPSTAGPGRGREGGTDGRRMEPSASPGL